MHSKSIMFFVEYLVFVKHLVWSKSKIDSNGCYAFRLISIKIVIQLKVAI